MAVPDFQSLMIPVLKVLSNGDALLGPEHYRAQDLEGADGSARLFLAHRIEPRGHVLGTYAFHPHPAEGGQDAGLEIDAHCLAPRRLPVRIAAAEIFVGQVLYCESVLLGIISNS